MVMSAGTGLLLWESHLVRVQADRLNGVDQELIAVLRFQTSLQLFDKRLNEIALSKDISHVLEESEEVRAGLVENARQTQAAFDGLSPEVRPDPALLATLESVESSLPAHLDGIRMLAASGDWTALRARVDNQFQPLELLSTEMVRGVDREVVAQRTLAAASIAQAEARMFLIVSVTGAITLLIAAFLGVVLTRSITRPLERLMEGSRALARGEFQHRISVTGEDELAQLGVIFNDTGAKLDDLYQHLQRSEAHLTEAQKLSHTGSWVWSIEHQCPVYWSAEMFRIHGLDPVQSPPAVGEVRALHPSGYWERFTETLRSSVREMADFDYGSQLLFPDGTFRYVRIVGHPVLNPAGDVVELMGTMLDVTAQHQAEEALRTMQDRLARARQIATVGELSASIAHEINQPLAAVVANGHACLKWLQDNPPNIERARIITERIIRDGNSTAEVVRRIRALFRQAPPSRSPVDINLVIAEVLRLLADGIRKKDVIVETDLRQGLPIVSADGVQLQQVALNLILNGIEAMDEVINRPKTLSVRSYQEGSDAVVVEVRDSGIGLKDPDRIFEALFTTKKEGMGMGLAICRSIVDGHQGRLWAEPASDFGTAFYFRLPVESGTSD
jgi:signal transduction histidine kinase